MKKKEINNIVDFMIDGEQIYYSQDENVFLAKFNVDNSIKEKYHIEDYYFDISNGEKFYGKIETFIKLPLINVDKLKLDFINEYNNLYLKKFKNILAITKNTKEAIKILFEEIESNNVQSDINLYYDFARKETELIFNSWYKNHLQ